MKLNVQILYNGVIVYVEHKNNNNKNNNCINSRKL